MTLTKSLTLTAGLALFGTLALADSATDQIVADLTANGFGHIEIKTGPTQIKAEAIGGGRKIEVVYDAATGSILSQETEAFEGNDSDNAPGVQVRTRSRDFVSTSGNADDKGRHYGDDDDDDNSHGSRHDDDHDDDHDSDDHDSDDHDDDDSDDSDDGDDDDSDDGDDDDGDDD